MSKATRKRSGSTAISWRSRTPEIRGGPATAALLLGLTMVSGCSVNASSDAGPYSASIGSNARTQQVDALGFAIVVDGDGNGRVVGTLTNTENGSHAVTGAAVKVEGTPVQAAHLVEVIRLPPHEPVELTEAPPVAVAAADLTVGSFVELTLDVTDGELVEMLVPVEPKKGPYSGVDVVPVPDGIVPKP